MANIAHVPDLAHVPYLGENNIKGLYGRDIYNPPVPFSHWIGYLYPGMVIFISGIPDSDCSRFSVNFESVKAESETTAFHFDVRFEYGDDRNVIVRNAKLNGVWTHALEERSLNTPFPFNRNEYFGIAILVEQSCFKVAVNNKYLLEFKHRFPIEDVNTLDIRGDVRISMVRIQR